MRSFAISLSGNGETRWPRFTICTLWIDWSRKKELLSTEIVNLKTLIGTSGRSRRSSKNFVELNLLLIKTVDTSKYRFNNNICIQILRANLVAKILLLKDKKYQSEMLRSTFKSLWNQTNLQHFIQVSKLELTTKCNRLLLNGIANNTQLVAPFPNARGKLLRPIIPSNTQLQIIRHT